MDPQAIERAREIPILLKAILEETRIVKERSLEILKNQRIIREELRSLDSLRPLRPLKEE